MSFQKPTQPFWTDQNPTVLPSIIMIILLKNTLLKKTDDLFF